uniref:Uncharacterized protein n=1 Tax=Anguilla anguilla TaxID=7936 RepID=A0A0E9T4I5_ANGAN
MIRRGRREPEPQPGAGRDPQVQRVLHGQQADGLRPQRARGVLSGLPKTGPEPGRPFHPHPVPRRYPLCPSSRPTASPI